MASQHQNQPPTVLSPLQRILQTLGYTNDDPAEDEEDRLLSTLTAGAREYLLQVSSRNKWPPKPGQNAVQGVTDCRSELKTLLGRALSQDDFHKAVAAIMLLENSPAGPIDSSLFDDVMHYVEDKGSSDVIPPQLLISWAKRLQVKGDLHGAIRKLNTAKTTLTEHKESFACPCEAEKIRAECLQLAGLTLNKMCCWKSAIQPLTESAAMLRECGSDEETAQAILTSVDMVARCLCTITHGDYLDLRDQQGFQHRDRFYQAYTMCKESAAMASSSSQLLYIKVQNQAAEALLKYSAQQEDVSTRNRYLQTVILEAQASLQIHSSMGDVARRGQFFEIIRSLFLIHLALDFSSSARDKLYAGKLEAQARVLYAEYCRQLSENDFIGDKIDVEDCPEVGAVLRGLNEDFGLKLDLQNVTMAAERSEELDRNDGNLTGKRSSCDRTNANEQTSQKSCEEAQTEEGDKEQTSSPHRQEVGLPINPEDYAIPVYDVPLTIFQDLCGCKFTTDRTQEREVRLTNQGTSPQGYTSDETAAEVARAQNDGGLMFGITEDSGYESSAALVDTILTTKLPDTEVSGSSDGDSGIDSSCSSADSSTPVSSNSTVTDGQSVLGTDLVKKARLLKFNPVTGLWSSQSTLVYVGQPLKLEDRLKGNCRDALHVQFLHQDEIMGRYVGKRYRCQRPPSQYLQDVTCQKTARFLVTLFNYALQDLRYDIQVVYVPVAHVQLLSHDGEEIEDWLNVEPYLEGDFIKLTNNLKFCNNQGRTLATALTHFTHSVSEGKLMLVDLQGWLPREGRGVVYLTDPQFHTNTPSSSSTPLSSCDMGPRGMQAFWDSVHPTCNPICQALGLKRPAELTMGGDTTASAVKEELV